MIHFVDLKRRPFVTVCGLKNQRPLTTSVEDLLAHPEPCKRCTEWVVEKGQQATQRLLDLTITEESK